MKNDELDLQEWTRKFKKINELAANDINDQQMTKIKKQK